MEKKFFQKPTTYVGQVSVNVTDMEKSLEFYVGFMGFKVLEKSIQKAILTADGKTPLITLEQPSDVKPKESKTTGLYHMAILLPSRSDLATFLKHLAETRGNTRLGAADHFVSEALYFDDPDGNGIEVAWDRPSTEWKWNEGLVDMATVQLDVQGLLQEAKSEWNGMPEDTLMGHIHLHVAQLVETEKFYVEGLGFNIVTRFPGALFASTNGYHHHIGLNIWNGVGAKCPEPNCVGLNWFTLVMPSDEAREEVVQRLNNLGVTVKEENGNYMTEDPSGNTIHLLVG